MKTRQLQLLLWFLVLISGCTTQEAYVETGITQLVQLTNDRSRELDPSWSRDGSRLVFASDRSGLLELWVMPVKGGGVQQVSSSSQSADRSPHFSPDQSEIVFQSSRVMGIWNIWKISLGNRGLTQLTNSPFGAWGPKWSPDGTRIAYSAKDKEGNSYIWVVDANGDNPTQLGPGQDPDWSPDGDKIAFSKEMTEEDYNIWIMNNDGSNPMQLTSEPEKYEFSPVWSPDGKSIAYVVQYDKGDFFAVKEGRIRSATDLRSEIWLMDPTGRNTTQLTAFKGLNVLPAWAPNGTIAFVSSRSGNWDIWSMIPNVSRK